VLVASAQACEPESRRQPFLVSDLDFDEVHNKVLMKAVLKTWEDIAVTYSFKITSQPVAPGGPALPKRDGKTMSLEHDFSQRLFDVNTKSLDIGVACNPCGTEGSVNIDFDLDTKWKIPVGASMTVTPQNLAAVVGLSLELGGELTSAYNPGDVNVVSVPLTGIDVAGFFKLGIFLTVVCIDLRFPQIVWAFAYRNCRMLASRLRNGEARRKPVWGQECQYPILPTSKLICLGVEIMPLMAGYHRLILFLQALAQRSKALQRPTHRWGLKSLPKVWARASPLAWT
jgi:hypothetical protein